MNLLLLISILLTCCLTANVQSILPPSPVPSTSAQSRSFPHEDKCGNLESSYWEVLSGKVVQVIDGNSIKVVLEDKRRKLVRLAAVDAPKLGQANGDAARNELAKLVLNKDVKIWVELKLEDNNNLTGVVEVQQRDINLALIESGVARYKTPKPYSMSNYTSCLYRSAEGEAREAGLGLWKRVSN